MILWLTGNTQAGKTTLGRDLTALVRASGGQAVHLDGDALRGVWADLGLSQADRRTQNARVLRLALELESAGHAVIVSVICPYRDQREYFAECGVTFWQLGCGCDSEDTPYESAPDIARWIIRQGGADGGHGANPNG